MGICWLAVSAEGSQVLWITVSPPPEPHPQLPTGRTGFAANPAVPPCRCLPAPHRRASSSTPPCRRLQEALPLHLSRLPPLLCPALTPSRRGRPRTAHVMPPKDSTMGTGETVSQGSHSPAIGPQGTRNEVGSRRAPSPDLLWLEISPPPVEGGGGAGQALGPRRQT